MYAPPSIRASLPVKSRVPAWDPGEVRDAVRDVSAPSVSRFVTIVVRLLPLLAASSWLATLTCLLVLSGADSKKAYFSAFGAVPYVSDAAYGHPKIFLWGSCATAAFFVASLVTERVLRSHRVLTEVMEGRTLWHVVAIADVWAGALAAIALLGMATYDLVHYPQAYAALATCALVFLSLSGLLQTVEVTRLWHEHPDRRDLEAGCFTKWTLITLISACGMVILCLHVQCDRDLFGTPTASCYRVLTGKAILQWIIAYAVGAFLATIIIDLWPIHRHTLRTAPAMHVGRFGRIHGMWMPLTAKARSASKTYVPLPPHYGVLRFPPRYAGSGDAPACGVQVVPLARASG